jgi:hypothetical protein
MMIRRFLIFYNQKVVGGEGKTGGGGGEGKQMVRGKVYTKSSFKGHATLIRIYNKGSRR